MSQAPEFDGLMDGLRAEWLALQAHHEQYERAALGIKLLAVALCALAFSHWAAVARGLWLLIGLLWLQEAIFKTFQGRLGERLLRVEALLREPDAAPGQAMQLHSEWLAGRAGGLGLLREYLRSACRPTVAFPYPVLMALSAWMA
ncbi:hypothetical protein WG899_05680 [Paucibacter sp. AS339]|uniref:hypothetical protein n=1 Tax=Paucibacter hankyongi TaxID=3133434 RepID=UPI003098849D